MRIIGGTHRGRIIITPKGWDTRPTRGRIRESVFNIIRNEIPDAAVLDLFAGSGALGLEAVSRGAKSAVFVDNAKPAREAIQQNIRSLQMTDQTRLLFCGYAEALRRLQSEKQSFDILFLDPPYLQADTSALFSQVQKSGVLKPGALWVYERAKRNAFAPACLRVVDERSYGDTSVVFMKVLSEA